MKTVTKLTLAGGAAIAARGISRNTGLLFGRENEYRHPYLYSMGLDWEKEVRSIPVERNLALPEIGGEHELIPPRGHEPSIRRDFFRITANPSRTRIFDVVTGQPTTFSARKLHLNVTFVDKNSNHHYTESSVYNTSSTTNSVGLDKIFERGFIKRFDVSLEIYPVGEAQPIILTKEIKL